MSGSPARATPNTRRCAMARRVRSATTALTALLLCVLPARAADQADAIYHGGDIVTIDDKNPTAEAVAVEGGKIVAVGKKDDVFKLKGDATKVIDLNGKTLLPGFIDAHGHLMGVGLQRSIASLLPPPDGKGDGIAGLQALLQEWAASAAARRIVGGKLILGIGYDDTQLKERRHPTRQELDAVSKDVPVIIIHQTGHFGVANTKALEMARITAETEDPLGGVIRREADGKTPNGVLEETAWFPLIFDQVLPLVSQG